MSSADVVRGAFQAVWREGDFTPIADSFVNHDPPPGIEPTKAGLAALHQALHAGFPDFETDLEDVVADGDRVAVRMTHRGTHTGPFLGLEPSGRPAQWSTVEILRVDHEQIVERWGVSDSLGLMAQIGAL